MTETIEEQIKRVETEIQRLKEELWRLKTIPQPPVKSRHLDEPWVPEVRG